MKILNLLSSMEKIELEMSALYEWLSSIFEDDSEASGLFFRMAMQENPMPTSSATERSWSIRRPVILAK